MKSAVSIVSPISSEIRSCELLVEIQDLSWSKGFVQGKLLEDIKIKQFLLVLLNDTLLTINLEAPHISRRCWDWGPWDVMWKIRIRSGHRLTNDSGCQEWDWERHESWECEGMLLLFQGSWESEFMRLSGRIYMLRSLLRLWNLRFYCMRDLCV